MRNRERERESEKRKENLKFNKFNYYRAERENKRIRERKREPAHRATTITLSAIAGYTIAVLPGFIVWGTITATTHFPVHMLLTRTGLGHSPKALPPLTLLKK